MDNEELKPLEEALFHFLCRKYVQRSDERQRSMGLQYTTAETHDLAKEVARFVDTRTTPTDGLREALEAISSQAICYGMSASEDELRDWLKFISETADAALATPAVPTEAQQLRKIIAELGYCTPDASLEFMRLIPGEVRAREAMLSQRNGGANA